MGTPASAVAAKPKVSFLKHFGQVVARILDAIVKDAAPVADQAAKVAEVLLPQFSGEIATSDNLIDNIAKQALITESVSAAATNPLPGQTKLDAVLTNIGPEIDAWVSSRFPGATALSNAAKAGLVNAVVAIANEVEGKTTVTAATATPAA